MKKMVVFLVVLFLIPLKVNALSSECAIVMDADSGRVLFEKNISKQKLIASTTKIMTAIIALEYGDLDTVVTVDEEVLKAYGSAIYIEIGEEITLKDLIYGLLLRSGNDAAVEIANTVSGSMESFVYLMNEKASLLGMKDTTFYNNHGLEEQDGKGNISTAYDMALLMKYAIKNEDFINMSSTKEYTTKTNYKTYIWPNKNKLLGMYEYTTAGKTGFTKKAKRTLVTSASKDGKNLIIVTLNDGNDFNNHMNLYEEYFNNYDLVTIIDKDTYKIEEDYYKGNLIVEDNFKLLVNKDEKKNLKTNVVLNKKEKYYNDDYVGYVEVVIDDEVVGKVNVYVKKKEETKEKKKSFFRKIIDFLIFWD